MKRKIQNLILLTLTLSLTACGVKLFKSSESSAKSEEDITRPPPIVVSEDKDFRVATDPDESVSFEEWKKKNSLPAETSEK